MIEKMKKITMLVSAGDKERFVTQLRRLGVLHVKYLVDPGAHEVSFLEEKAEKIEKMISRLGPYAGEKRRSGRALQESDILTCAEETEEDLKMKREAEEKLRKLGQEKQWFEYWGHIRPDDVLKVRESGANIRLYEAPVKALKKVDTEGLRVVGQQSGKARAVFISADPAEELPLQEVPLPGRSEEKTRDEIAVREQEKKEIEERLKARIVAIPDARECLAKIQKELAALRVMCGMKNEGTFDYIQGFSPEKSIPGVKKLCEKTGSGYVFEEPDNPEETPTLITNPKWVELIRPVFSFMNTLPGYEEFDISAVFLVFFSLFFAMLIGDAGYGLVFIAIAYFARKKFRNAPKQPFFLIYLLGGCTVVWGSLTGTWFGVEQLAGAPVLKHLVIERIGSFSGDNQNFMIQICFVIGVIHLTLAHLMKIARQINSIKALAEAGWILILWGLFFLAGKFVIATSFPPVAGWMIAAGIIMVLVFTAPEKGIIKGMVSVLTQLPLSVISSFSDIVSYLRLFAVGVATVVVADSFNKMAWPGPPSSFIGGFLSAMVLFLGHALNITLGCMAVIVHGIRLNMLEFSGHLGMQWSGRKYEPFKE